MTDTTRTTRADSAKVNDGWPTPEEFERGWWVRDPKAPTALDIAIEYDRMRRDQAG